MGCLVVGLTGQTGSGKSTVSRILTDCGIPVIDCDRLAREAVEPGSECLLQLVQAFGAKILQQDGSLDRAKMAAIAFPDPEKLEMLNSITHKAILRLLEKRLEMLVSAGETLVVVDAPTLFESGASYDDLFDEKINIQYGTFLLKTLLDEFGSEANALCAYHAGWGNAKKWLQSGEYAPDGENIQNIPFGDTSRYVEKVIETQNTYEKLYDFSVEQ